MGATPLPRVPMGLQPIVRKVPTRYEALRALYVEGKIDLDKFEEVVGGLLAKGIENDPVAGQFPRPQMDVQRY